jgi:transcriptional regulator with XRE-family HTH domain
MMNLASWMAERGETDESMSKKVGVSRVQITRIRNNTSKPSPKVAMELERVTGIPAWDFLRPEAA